MFMFVGGGCHFDAPLNFIQPICNDSINSNDFVATDERKKKMNEIRLTYD